VGTRQYHVEFPRHSFFYFALGVSAHRRRYMRLEPHVGGVSASSLLLPAFQSMVMDITLSGDSVRSNGYRFCYPAYDWYANRLA